jgi:26S proteasome regulatory subunit N1
VDQIVPFNILHNAEPEACDLLLEVERLRDIRQHADETNYSRICLYLLGIASYATEPEDAEILNVVLEIYRSLNKLPEAIFTAMRLGDPQVVKEVFESADDPLVALFTSDRW